MILPARGTMTGMSRIEKLNQLHQTDPSDADVLYMLAQEHAKEGEHAQAITWYDACLHSDPGYHYAFYHKARSQEARGDVPSAKATLREGLERAQADSQGKAVEEIREYLASLGD